jgi:hypothetical protein
MASIHERERLKGVVFMVSYRDPSGNQHTKTFARRRDAESFARRVEVEKEDGRWSDPAAGRVTVADFWNHFLATSHPGRTPDTERSSSTMTGLEKCWPPVWRPSRRSL